MTMELREDTLHALASLVRPPGSGHTVAHHHLFISHPASSPCDASSTYMRQKLSFPTIAAQETHLKSNASTPLPQNPNGSHNHTSSAPSIPSAQKLHRSLQTTNTEPNTPQESTKPYSPAPNARNTHTITPTLTRTLALVAQSFTFWI